MKIDALQPYNNQVIPTKMLKELGYKTSDINKLLKQEILVRTKKGYYKVVINEDIDTSLVSYYLMNNLFDEFVEYYESLPFKSYMAYYYHFMYDIMVNDYDEAYKSLTKCCELNKNKDNKVNLYAYVLLLNELMNLSNKKLITLKNKIFDDKEDTLSLFLEHIIRKDYDNACQCLRKNKDNLPKLEVKVLRNLSLKASLCYKKKNSKEMKEYEQLLKTFYNCTLNNDFEASYYYFSKVYELANSMGIKDQKMTIFNDLFSCFNYIVLHPDINLDTYKTKYKYTGTDIDNFYQALNHNDYIKALEFTSKIIRHDKHIEFAVYHNLLSRIYNFLNIRSIIKGRGRARTKLDELVEEKKYEAALEVATNNPNLDTNSKNIITSLLESLVAIDDVAIDKENG